MYRLHQHCESHPLETSLSEPSDIVTMWLFRCEEVLADWRRRPLDEAVSPELALDSIVTWQGTLRTQPEMEREGEWELVTQQLRSYLQPLLNELFRIADPCTPEEWLRVAETCPTAPSTSGAGKLLELLFLLDESELFAAAWNSFLGEPWEHGEALLRCHTWLQQHRRSFLPVVPVIQSICDSLRPPFGLKTLDSFITDSHEQQLVLTAHKFHDLLLWLQPSALSKKQRELM